jgi:hypothetical protein
MTKVSADRLSTLIGIASVAGVLSGTPAVLVAQGEPRSGRSLKRHQAVPAITAGKLPASDPSAIAQRWGIEIESMRLASSNYMLEFRYRILDANKAQPLFGRGLSPRLHDEASSFESTVPNPPTTGALRSTYDAKAGRTYFMFFANPSQFVKAGSRVTVTIGDFSVTGITVTADAAPSASATGENRP